MRIESIHIHGFGHLVDRRYDFPAEGAALIMEANESGKSTLAAAILAGLCGFPSRRASGESVKAELVYRPWDTDRYALDMDIEVGGRRLRIERDFDSKSFVVRDRETNRDISAGFNPDLTAGLLHLPREDFQRVAFISGKEVCNFSSSTGIQSRLSALVEGSDCDESAEPAIAILENTGYLLGGRSLKTETAICRISAGIAEKTRALAELEAALDAADHEVRLLDSLQTSETDLSARLSELDNEYNQARFDEISERIRLAEANAFDIAELQQEISGLERYRQFPAERSGQLSSAVTRVNERAAHLAQLKSESDRLNRLADDLRSRLSGSDRFAAANETDLIQLSSLESELTSARSAAQKLAESIERETNEMSRAGGRVLVGLGGVCGIACIALMIARVMPLVESLIGVLAGVVVGAVGLVQVARSRSLDSDARSRSQQAQDFGASVRERAAGFLSGLGMPSGVDVDIAVTLVRARDALSRYLADRCKLQETEADLAAAGRKEADWQRSIAEEKQVIASILSDAGIDPALTNDEALTKFTEAEANYRRYRHIRDTLLPALQKNAVPLEALEKLRAEQAELPTDVSQTAGAPASPFEVDSARQSIRCELDETIDQIRRVERSVGTCVETYRREVPGIQEELAKLNAELERASRFEKAIRIAVDVMREVSEAAHRRWAVALNEQASGILPHLNPDYDTLLFDDSLGFTIKRTSDNRIIEKSDIDARLSDGAKDQIYLTVRLACCGELSRLGESIPIILDDPLIASDDSRFERGFEYLCRELAKENQVIILSCHKSRHNKLRAMGWFADRVSIVEL